MARRGLCNSILDIFEFRQCRWFYFTFVLSFAGGIVLGLFFGGTKELELIGGFSSDYFLVVFSVGSLSPIVWSRVLNNFAVIIILALPCISAFLIPVDYLVIIYRGFIFGGVMVFVVLSYSVSGVLLLIFLLIPIQFVYLIVLLSASVNSIWFSLSRCGVGNFSALILRLLLIYLMSILVLVIELIIITLIIRPLNFII